MNELTCTASDGTKWTVYKDDDDEWRWRSEAGGHIVGAAHEGYVNRSDCIANARRPGLDAEPEEQPDGTWNCKGSNGDDWEFYKDAKDKWRVETDGSQRRAGWPQHPGLREPVGLRRQRPAARHELRPRLKAQPMAVEGDVRRS